MAVSQTVQEMMNEATEEEFVWSLAAECFMKIDSAGGIGCTLDGQERVVKAMLSLIEKKRKAFPSSGPLKRDGVLNS